ncbi:hypothetical protein N7457_009448 [Penicillium paradoxum]|uniref:uncharacterized protein n=1 Tax=Penicillium paradoxum TaxID=176176 RepID=UPI002548F68B|nr:uncharacterized protein N7457_009448 [Penicillium paradoxum]KAJ5774552.1 hypothetical protein N7457_009448 [Penicillium paradoxum]
MKHRKALLALLALISPSTAIPYTPSSVFLSSRHNGSLAYILRPSAGGDTEFLSLNLSSSIDAEDLKSQTLLKNTPFHSSEQNSTFVSAIDDQGRITVYTGNCHDAFDNPELWQFSPNPKKSDGNGTWNRLPVTTSDGTATANYLAAGFTYAAQNAKESSMYAFGGMCPFTNSTDETWISAANYSQSMVVLGPNPYYTTKFSATTTGKRAPPVAEAGMAVVPLQATYSTGSKGKQQDFLFIGGHTREAFLNMSQLAIFSLPQQSWSFVSTTSDSRPKTELTVRDMASIEPRSGHTALLSEKGDKVFVFGGWVGDMTVPADPQFAVLDIAEGFGGATEWAWRAPSLDGLGIAEGSGIFGHGAVLLPGDVMMISGGYSIPKPSSKRAAATVQSNSRVYLYNVTSNSWVTSYTNPAAKSSNAPTGDTGKLSSSQKAGLGVGIGIGCPAALAFVLYGCNYHRKRRVKSKRDSQLRELALGAERSHFWGRDGPDQASSIRGSGMSEKKEPPVFPWSANRSQTSKSSWNDQGEGTAERTGLLGGAPPPKNKRPPAVPPVNARPYSYRNSEYRRSDATGDIHPIDEREEDEAFREQLMATIPSETKATTEMTKPDDPFSDTPYATPRSTIFGVGLGPFYSRRKDIGSVDAESPTKSDRTATDLSENSGRSLASNQPVGKVSQAQAVLVDRPRSWGSGRHSLEYLAAASTHSDPDGVAPSDQSVSADSFSTAQTNLNRRQSENEWLLLDGQDPPTSLTPFGSSSPSKLPRESKPKASDWVMNTMRRALTMTRRSPDNQSDTDHSTTSTAEVASGIDRRSTLVGSGQRTPASGLSTPRRAVSASAELFRRKQGAKDWNARKRVSDDVFNTAQPARDDMFFNAPGYLGNDDICADDEEDVHDWDLEGAAEGRRVQVAFTVPREKLRVVNATAGDMDSVSERSVSWSTGNRRVST